MNSTQRFSDRVSNYIKYRPSYPKGIINFLEQEIGLTTDSVIADIGSGTGISAELFLKNSNKVYGVEPNKEMREAAERLLQKYSKFKSINAPAENTGLESYSLDYVLAAQAFHWFDIEKCKVEFKRILKPGGYVVLLWNDRKTESTPFLKAYEELLNKFSTDYQKVNHKNIDEKIFDNFFGKNNYKLKIFPNEQVFDYDGLYGRLMSSSYAPPQGHHNYEYMIKELKNIFEKYHESGKVVFEYETKLYYGRL